MNDLDTPTPNERLAAQLTALLAQLSMVPEDVRYGLFDDAQRHQLADTLEEVAQDVRPETVPLSQGVEELAFEQPQSNAHHRWPRAVPDHPTTET